MRDDVARSMFAALGVGGALVACLIAACTVVSGTSELSGGQCRKCVDASALDARDDASSDAAGTRVTCGATSCDTRSSWCCVAPTAATTCADPCPRGASAMGCRVPSDCAAGTSCCAFRSNFGGESEVRAFSDCLTSCNPSTDEVVCDPRASSPCVRTGGACVQGDIPFVSVCR